MSDTNTVPPMDPQARALLERLNARPQPDTRGMSSAQWAETCRRALRDNIPLAGAPEPVYKVEDREVAGPGVNIPVRVYAPRADAALPALVFFHGGGFVSGDLDTHDAPLRALANAAGCVIVSVAYRPAPEYPFPAAPEDCYAATQWVAAHADAFGADAGRVAVGGDSSGGCLAAVVCLMARDRGGIPPAFQALLYPDTDLTENTESWRELATSNAPINTLDGKGRNRAAYVPAGADIRTPYLSPLYAPDLSGLPPALVVTGECDPQRDEGEAYAERLRAAGNAVTLTRYPGMIHGFFQMAGVLDAGGEVIRQVADALRR